MAGPTLFRPNSIPTGLVSYWPLSEPSGTRYDSIGSNHLTDNNTVASVAQDYWKTGENSADFERSNSEYLSIADGSQTGLDLTGAWSFAAFVKTENSAVAQTIVSKKNLDGDADGYKFGIYTDNKLFIYNSASLVQATGSTIPAGKWTHVAVVYTGSLVLFYVDGNLDTVVSSATNPAGNSIQFALGCRGSIAQDFFDGLMKDAAIWNVALTPIQMKSLALGVDLSSLAYRPTNVSVQPTHYWKMNEAIASGTRAATVGGVNLTDVTTTTSKGGYIEGAAPDFSSDYLSAPDSANWDVGTGDFGFGWWAYHDSSVNGRYIFSHGASPSLGIRYTGGQWLVYLGGASPIAFTYTQPLATWEYYFIKRSGTSLTLWIDGVQVASAVNSTNVTGGATVFSIGAFNDGSNAHDGRICEFAFWKGYAPTDAEIKSLACGIPLQQQGIVSYFKMDESSGTRADSIGSNPLSDNNTVLSAAGKVGDAADFESGNSEYLSAADSPDWDFGSDGWSISKWVKFETVASARMWAFGQYSSGKGIQLDYSAGSWTLYNNGNAGTTDAFSFTPTVATWYHITLVRDGANVYFKVNASDISSSANTDVIDGGTAGATIGVWVGTLSNYFDGLMDEFLLAKRWLRPEEVKTIYCKGLAGKELTNSEISLSTLAVVGRQSMRGSARGVGVR